MIVVDTSVVVSGLRSPAGASAEVLRLVLNREIAAAASVALILEYESVATRPAHLAAAGLEHRQVLDVIDALAAAMRPTPIRWRLRPMSGDPGDDFVLEAAFNAGASSIVTGNLRDLQPASVKIGIRALTPAMLLSELER
ncbi:MAG TPA: putative toxin-antitoxin system toxin component, PIN family [Terricaulis sp.]|nr:putative toxin-antitoxin system toxin component, PIN family [Terricaulis sp.]